MKKIWLIGALIAQSALAAPKVVTTIKPIHAIASQVMEGVSEPTLLIKQASPHGYQLTTQDAKTLNDADVVVWTGKDMETFIPSIAAKVNAQFIDWSSLTGVELLATRFGGSWGEHDHAEGEDHHHGEHDLHLWLSTYNASILATEIAKALSSLDPENAEKYQANAKATRLELSKLHKELHGKLKPYQKQAYLVFHDAYQYFEHDYGLGAVGSVRVTPEHEANPKRLAELHQMLSEKQIVCVFKEPQFPSRLVDKLVSGTQVKTGILDPLGTDVPVGKGAYAGILHQLADDLIACLK